MHSSVQKSAAETTERLYHSTLTEGAKLANNGVTPVVCLDRKQLHVEPDSDNGPSLVYCHSHTPSV
jgi:hypothetical protein